MTKSIGKVCFVFALFFGILACFFVSTTKDRTEERNSYRQQLNAAYFVFEAIASNKDELREMRVLLQENPGNNLVYVTTHTPAKTEYGTASTSVFTIFSDGNLKVERYDDTNGAKTWETVEYRGDHYAKK